MGTVITENLEKKKMGLEGKTPNTRNIQIEIF